MKKIHTYVLKHGSTYLLAFVSMFLAIGLDMLYPQITKSIVNEVFVSGELNRLPMLLIGIAVCGVGRCIFGYLKEFTFDKTGSRIGGEMRKDLFSHIQGLSMDYFDNTNTGELMARIKDDVDKIWSALGFLGMLTIEVVVHVVSVIYCMFHLSPYLTILPVLFMMASAVVAILMEKKLNKVYEDISEENATLTTIAEENLAGVRTVKAFAREDYEIKKFLSHNQKYYELNMKQAKTMVRYYPFFQFVSVMLPVATAICGGMLVVKGQMDIGSLVAYVEYSRNCTWPMQMIGWLVNDISSAFASKKKIDKICKEHAKLQESKNPIILDLVKGDIRFEHVSFDADGKKILEDISFHIPAGKTLGVMGATGSGKSTIITLLERFFDPTKGEIYLEGKNIKELTFAQLRKSMAVVMQDVFLFSDTIAENIKMGKQDVMLQKDMEQASKLAMADSFIEKLEQKYETIIGERGVGLSGGQKQRISIARAVSKQCPILILDDATSALDMETEREIQKNLNKVKEATKMIIAHRISAVRHADEIIYLQDGKIAERGTHEELLAKKGLYYDTYMVQYGQIERSINLWQ